MARTSFVTHLRYLVALAAIGVVASSCTALFDYGSEVEGTGGTASQGGSGGSGGSATGAGGGAEGCVADGDCDDDDECTVDSCSAGSCSHEPVADDTPCTSGGGEPGSCQSGSCIVACTGDNPDVCDDDNVCTVDGCDVALGQCTNEPVPDGEAAASVQTEGDCKVVQCVDGQPVEQSDGEDLPVDNNACTNDLCADGEPSNPNLPEGTSCGGTLVCDGEGVCVGCNQPSDCPGADSFCQTITCANQQCGVDYTAAGTALPGAQQTAGPCQEIQCNGMGGTQTVNLAGGSPCDDGLHCNGADSCLSGNCSQHAGDPCPGADGDGDCSETCDETNDDCGGNDLNGSACNDGLYCNGNDTCQGGSCSQHAGDPCPGPDGDGDCSESCNETANDCSGNDPNDSVCDDKLYCNGADTCQGGSCSQHAGNPCPEDVDDDCKDACNETDDACTGITMEGSVCIYDQNQLGCCAFGTCYPNCP